MLPAPHLALAAALALLTACSGSGDADVPSTDAGAPSESSIVGPARVQFRGACMGTVWSCVLELEEGQTGEPARDLVQAKLDEIDRDLSTWKDDSDLSRFNRAGAHEPVAVSDATRAVFELAKELYAATDGAFDPTVEPLVALWGFSSYDASEPPTDASIEEARGRLGFDEVTLGDEGLVKARAEIQLNMSAIAKGYAVDVAADALTEAGYGAFLLEVGGELVARGIKPDGTPWRVGIEDPRPPEGTEQGSLEALSAAPVYAARIGVTGKAVAGSGDYRNVRVVDGRTVAHAIDPRTGRPIEHAVGATTVVASDCGTADALATAALVLGAEAGLDVLEKAEGVEGLLLERGSDGELIWHMTTGFEALDFERRGGD